MKKVIMLFIIFFGAVGMTVAQRTISGVVADGGGEALIGANVLVENSTIGTVTDLDGSFSLSVPDGTTTLVVSYTGFTTMNVDVSSSDFVNITMSEGELLDEIVVVGYGSAKKNTLVQSISSVSGDEIASIPLASVDNLLQGRSTGVEVTSINGKPGANAYIRVRGLTSINGNNDPLFIVDGIAVPKDVYSAINPSDIEEFSILKDAAATSIYGARASAGVVLVTTKRGSASNSRIEYSYSLGYQEAIDDKFELMNASQKLNYEIAAGVRGPITAEERAEILKYGTDWQDVLIRPSNIQTHNLAFSGGDDKGNYYLSASHYTNGGLSVGSDFDRTTAKFNGGYKINDWLTVRNSLSYSLRNETEVRDRYNAQSPFAAAYFYNPYETIYNLDSTGNVQYNELGEPSYNLTSQGFNIVEAVRNNPESVKRNDIYGSIGLDINPVQNLTLTTNLGYIYNNYSREYFIKPNSILDGFVGDANAPGIKTDNGFNRNNISWSNTANYIWDMDDSNNFSFLVGTEFIKDDYNSYSVSGKGFPVGLSTQDNAAEITGGQTYREEWALFSTFGQVIYGWNDRLYVNASLRRDGSSRFGKDNRYGTFYGVGAGYDLTYHLPGTSMFDQLKLRASYGTTGNEPTALYSSLGVLAIDSYSNETTVYQNNVANPNLQWETQKAYSVGVDFGVLNNRVTGSVEYYTKIAEDLIFPGQLSRTTGFATITENVGSLKNVGVEAEVYYDIVRKKDWQVDFGVRFSTNKATIETLNTDEEVFPANSIGTVLNTGRAAYEWKLVRYEGVDPETGDLVYLNANGERTTTPTASDEVLLDGKSPLPKFSGGFDFNVGYKKVMLSTQFSFKGGNYIYNLKKRDLLSGADGARGAQDVEALDYWQEPGDITDIPRLGAPVEAVTSDRFLEKGDYLRLRNVRLSYSLPVDLIKKLKFSELSVFVSGSNLLTFTGFQGEPEVGVFLEESVTNVDNQVPGEYYGYSYPNARTFTAGVAARF